MSQASTHGQGNTHHIDNEHIDVHAEGSSFVPHKTRDNKTCPRTRETIIMLERFDHLAQFARTLVGTEADRIEEFTTKLQPDIQPYLSVLPTTNFTAAYNQIEKAEKGLIAWKKSVAGSKEQSTQQKGGVTSGGKRTPGGGHNMQHSKNTKSGPAQSGASSSKPRPSRHPKCNLCGRNHPGECWFTHGLCLGCKHQTIIDCGLCTVRLKADDDGLIEVKGELLPKPPEFVSLMQAKRLIRKRCKAFLCNVRDVRKMTPKLKDIPSVNELPDVFPDDLPGLPPPREVEFSIDLIPGTEPISATSRYRSDPSHILPERTVALDESLSYEEEPVQILGREVKELRNKFVPLVKVLWRNHSTEEATWETEESKRTQYPHLFSDQ
ncbi:unnamed protein product [Cuscuta campestris]|uniref:Chromo domain-containing protein n=1 Tax=Cuscuta campestris TaxID=132261 RepID=A0A484L9N1_9ASTE|nr:unnamed protein product [Cuscuta campestris]